MTDYNNVSQADIKAIKKDIERKWAIRSLVSVCIVFLFALTTFLLIHIFSNGNSEYQPIAQIKQNGQWTLVRTAPKWFVDPNAVGIEFVTDEDNGTYDLVIHYQVDDTIPR